MNEIREDIDRRDKPRIACAFPAKVSGVAKGGNFIQESTFLRNLSASGLFLRMHAEIQIDACLSIIFRVSKSAPLVGQGSGPLIAVEGRVVRSEVDDKGLYGVAVKFDNHRFL